MDVTGISPVLTTSSRRQRSAGWSRQARFRRPDPVVDNGSRLGSAQTTQRDVTFDGVARSERVGKCGKTPEVAVSRLIGSVMALVLVASTALAALPPGGAFLDDDLNPHEGNIEALVASGVVNGCSVDPPLYCPLMLVTRAETAALLVRSIGALDDSVPYRGTFADVSEEAWYAEAVEQAADLGIMYGTDDGRCLPNEPVTRSEMAVSLVRALEGESELLPAWGVFADVPLTADYAQHVERVWELGISMGCSTDPLSFCPLELTTRGEMASFLARGLGLDPMIPPPRPDIPSTTSTSTTVPIRTTTTVPPTTTTTCPPAAPI